MRGIIQHPFPLDGIDVLKLVGYPWPLEFCVINPISKLTPADELTQKNTSIVLYFPAPGIQ